MKKAISYLVCITTVISMSVSIFAMETMKTGAKGDNVKEVQEMLISQGYLEDVADGKFGPKTEKAVLAFQQDNGLDATGIVGEATYNALKNGASDQETDAAPAEEPPVEEIDYSEVFPSWNPDSASLGELVDFVSASTDESSPDYLDPADRIATFDMDGTILCEKAPVYFDYCLTMYRVLDDPSFNATEEEKDAMQQIRDHAYSEGETFHPEGITKDDLVATAFAGMAPEEFRSYVVDFADNVDAVGFE